MEHTITISEEIYTALQHQANRQQKVPDALAEEWLKQHLNLEQYPELEWRQGVSGWRAGIKNTALDVYTVVGYSQIGYAPQEIADDLLPQLSVDQVRSSLRYYADYPDEIEQILAKSEPELIKALLYRSLGPKDYYRLTGTSEAPTLIREAYSKYDTNEQG